MPKPVTTMLPAETNEFWGLLLHASVMSENHNNLIEDLKLRRRNMGVSDEEFSRLSSISVDVLNRFEYGDGEILLSDLRCYALALGVTFTTNMDTISK